MLCTGIGDQLLQDQWNIDEHLNISRWRCRSFLWIYSHMTADSISWSRAFGLTVFECWCSDVWRAAADTRARTGLFQVEQKGPKPMDSVFQRSGSEGHWQRTSVDLHRTPKLSKRGHLDGNWTPARTMWGCWWFEGQVWNWLTGGLNAEIALGVFQCVCCALYLLFICCSVTHK